jgi:hypothetical protein
LFDIAKEKTSSKSDEQFANSGVKNKICSLKDGDTGKRHIKKWH